jgi:hypothetical protein
MSEVPKQLLISKLTPQEQAWADHIERHRDQILMIIENTDKVDQMVILKEVLVYVIERWFRLGDRGKVLRDLIGQVERALSRRT